MFKPYWVRVEWWEGSGTADFDVEVWDDVEGGSPQKIAYKYNIVDDVSGAATRSVVLEVDTTPYAAALDKGKHQ